MAGREPAEVKEKPPFRMTAQRRVLLEALRGVRTHPTADELFRMVRRRLPSISLATVYRNLEELSRSGVILKLATAGEQKRFDGFPEEHYHVRCVRCGRVEDVMVKPIPAIGAAAKRIEGFRVGGYTLEYYGECRRCAKGQGRARHETA